MSYRVAQLTQNQRALPADLILANHTKRRLAPFHDNLMPARFSDDALCVSTPCIVALRFPVLVRAEMRRCHGSQGRFRKDDPALRSGRASSHQQSPGHSPRRKCSCRASCLSSDRYRSTNEPAAAPWADPDSFLSLPGTAPGRKRKRSLRRSETPSSLRRSIDAFIFGYRKCAAWLSPSSSFSWSRAINHPSHPQVRTCA